MRVEVLQLSKRIFEGFELVLLLVDKTGTTNCRARQKLKERVPLLLSDVGYCHLLHRLVLIFLMYLLITVIH